MEIHYHNNFGKIFLMKFYYSNFDKFYPLCQINYSLKSLFRAIIYSIEPIFFGIYFIFQGGDFFMNSKPLDWTALTILIIGAINWGLIGFFQFDLIAAIFGGVTSWVSRILYAIVGIAGIYSLCLFNKVEEEELAHS